jgi:hypothetical protein
MPSAVIPAKAGIQLATNVARAKLGPGLRRSDESLGVISNRRRFELILTSNRLIRLVGHPQQVRPRGVCGHALGQGLLQPQLPLANL